MPLRKLDHVQLAMPPGEEEAARLFYRDVLGLAEAAKPPNLAKRGGVWFDNGDVRVHLGVQDDFTPATKAHPAFEVDDLPALMERCLRGGVRMVNDEPLPGYDRVYVYDPFGNRIELMEPSKS